MRLIATIEGSEIVEDDSGRVVFMAKARIDNDGGKNPEHDPYWQPNTSLRQGGKPVDAEVVPYVVVPPAIIRGVKGVVLGCQASVTDMRTGKSTPAVVADEGPKNKLGEISVACAKALGIPSSPIDGGVNEHVILYELWPGTAAQLYGTTYQLQPAV